MGGALAERDFAEKLEKGGFADIVFGDRLPLGVDDVADYPLFTEELLQLMRDTISAERRGRVVVRVMITARKPA